MLRSLEIRNYRNLRHLTIEKLGRVNLLVGKNNTGKTSVLEAIAIVINQGNLNSILQLLEERGENYINSKTESRGKGNSLKAFSALFYNHKPGFSEKESIAIGEMDHHQATSTENGIDIRIRFVKFIEYFIPKSPGQISPVERTYIDENSDTVNYQMALEMRSYDFSRDISLNSIDEGGSEFNIYIKNDTPSLPINYQFIRTKNIDRIINANLWDQIVLKDEENEVIDALKIIESDIERLAFLNDNYQGRMAVVKLNKDNDVVPLRSMGDGINRIFTIVLAMVNCKKSYLLIDEFENGLHYSVQEKLWEIIFYLAERLNIQVFATTHSLDCVEAFSAILNDGKQDKNAGAMIRLENYEGTIEATVYDADEIQSTTRVHVDPR